MFDSNGPRDAGSVALLVEGAHFIERVLDSGDDLPDVLPISLHLGDSFIKRLPRGGGIAGHPAKTCCECAVRVYRTFGLRTSMVDAAASRQSLPMSDQRHHCLCRRASVADGSAPSNY